MKFSSKVISPESVKTPCIIVPVFESNALSASASQLNNASQKAIINIIKKGDIEGKTGQTLLLHHVAGIEAERVLLVGCGKSGSTSDKQFRKACAAAATTLKNIKAKSTVFMLHEIDVDNRDMSWKIAQAVQITTSLSDRRDTLKSEKDDEISKSYCFRCY